MLRIGFIGKMRAGKDTAAEYLHGRHGGVILKFADPLYDMQRYIYERAGLDLSAIAGKDRKLLQWLGTEWGREIDPELWVKAMERAVLDHRAKSIYVSDIRFPNEVNLLRKLGFQVWKIHRPDQDRIKAGATREAHVSEQMIETIEEEKIDHHVHNHGSLYDYFRALEDLLPKGEPIIRVG